MKPAARGRADWSYKRPTATAMTTATRLETEAMIEAPRPATRPSDCMAMALMLPNSRPLQLNSKKQRPKKKPGKRK